MVPDPSIWEQRGSHWYRIGDPHRNRYHIGTCEHCGNEALMQRASRFCSRSCSMTSQHVRRGDETGANNPNWKGALIGYDSAHKRVYRARGKAAEHVCVDCGAPAAHWSYDGKDPDELAGTWRHGPVRYSAKPEHYEPRCVTCHNRHDINYQRGEHSQFAKLTDEQVRAIRTAGLVDEDGMRVTQQQVADVYGVSRSLISLILRGRCRQEAA